MLIPQNRRAPIARPQSDRCAGSSPPTARPVGWLRPLGLVTAALLLIVTGELRAATPHQATTSRAAREDAVRSIPFDKLPAEDVGRIKSVVANTSIYRRLPIQVTDCDPDLYLFLVRHPEVVVNIWSVMGMSKITIERQANSTFRATDGAGTVCNIKLCYSTHDTQVIFAEGRYDGAPFSKPIKASCLLLVKSGYLQETNNRYYVTTRLDAFIHIDQVGVELLAKTFQPLITKSADTNFVETTAFLGNVSRTAETHPRGMNRLVAKLTNVKPDVRERFGELTAQVAERAAERSAAKEHSKPTLIGASPAKVDKR